MSNVKIINGYDIKDATARNSIEELNNQINVGDESIVTVLTSLDNQINNDETGLETRVENLEETIADPTTGLGPRVDDLEDETSQLSLDIKLNDEHACQNYAHRGLSSEAPENTLASIYKAGYHGCAGVEIDAQVTADDKIVVMHDSTVDRTTDGTGTVNDLQSSYIESLNIDAGNNVDDFPTQHVPYLSEALEVCAKFGMIPVIELKGTWADERLADLVDLITSYNYLKRAIVICFTDVIIIRLRAITKDLKVGLLTSSILTDELIDEAIELGNCCLSLSYSQNETIDESLRLKMIRNGIDFGFWTVNSLSTKNTLLTNNPGCSHITSNYGFGGSLKQFNKQLVGLVDSEGMRPWAKTTPSNSNAIIYDDFTVAVDDADTNRYSLTYKTPLDVEGTFFNGVVTANIDNNYKNNYSVRCRTESNTGFNFYIVDDSNTAISLSDYYTATGGGYIHFNISGYH